MDRIQKLIQELRRRRVVQTGIWFGGLTLGVLGLLDILRDLFPLLDRIFPALVVAGAVLFPVVLVLSWAFDVGPNGIRWAQPPEGSEIRMGSRIAAIAVVVAASAVFGMTLLNLWDRSEGQRAEAVDSADSGLSAALDPTHLAVLYFDDYSPGGELSYLANGLTEDVINALVNVPGLTVTSRNGVKPYRDNPVPSDSIARALRVGTIVEGSVTGSGERIRATAQLIDAPRDRHLWSGQFEAPAGDVLALQDTLVEAITMALRETLGVELENRRTLEAASSSEAWTLYQRAMELFDLGRGLASAGSEAMGRRLQEADSIMARVEELDPEWADPSLQRGWLALSTSRARSAQSGYVALEDTTWVLEMAQRAVDRAGETPAALELRGIARFEVNEAGPSSAEGYALAADDLERAVREDPTLARAWSTLSDIYRFRGDFVEAGEAARTALEADAFLAEAPQITMRLFEASLDGRDLQEADQWCSTGRRRFPDNPDFIFCRFMILTSWPERADPDHAWALGDSLQSLGSEDAWEGSFRPWALMQTAKTLARTGDPDSARAVARMAHGDERRDWLSYDEAHLSLLLGDRERALDLLAVHLSEISPGRWIYLREDWWFEDLWDDPRFLEITAPPGGEAS